MEDPWDCYIQANLYNELDQHYLRVSRFGPKTSTLQVCGVNHVSNKILMQYISDGYKTQQGMLAYGGDFEIGALLYTTDGKKASVEISFLFHKQGLCLNNIHEGTHIWPQAYSDDMQLPPPKPSTFLNHQRKLFVEPFFDFLCLLKLVFTPKPKTYFDQEDLLLTNEQKNICMKA